MLNKQDLAINFGQGLDTKSDPFQLQFGKFLQLSNSVFDKAGRLTKRNGFAPLTSLPDTTSKILTTFNGNLTTIGNKLEAYSQGTAQWVNKGSIQPVDLNTIPLVRNNTSQLQADAVVADNGLVCVVYTDQDPADLANNVFKYAIIDSVTGQNIVAPTLLPILPVQDPIYSTPRVYLLDNYFIILFTSKPASYHLQYIAISANNPTIITTPMDITNSYAPSTTLGFDALVVNSRLYIAYNTTTGGQAIDITYITNTLSAPVTPKTYVSAIATMFSLAADTTNTAIIYVSYYDSASTDAHVLAVDSNLNAVLAPTLVSTGQALQAVTSTAGNGSANIYYEVVNSYAYSSGDRTDYIATKNVTQSGTVSSESVVVRSVGLASKAFQIDGVDYFLALYNTITQPSYFLINGIGQVISKLAYSNGPSNYYLDGLPNVTVRDDVVSIPYLYRDLIQAVNKTQGIANSSGIYAQTGINLASFTFDVSDVISNEIGGALNLTGGYMATYDGVTPVEQGFFLYPDVVSTAAVSGGGSMTAQIYYYQVTYEWADNQGNIFRSAPCIPSGVTLSATGSVTINVPTLRLTYKIDSPVRIVIYRWSAAQESYYQVTSIQLPLLNDTTIDYVTYTDTLADASILGNNLIYTTGGVIEDIVPPASNNACLFNNRLFLVDAEDRNLLWFSKQVIEATPVEMSDLLTIYVAPTTASQGSTGPITALSPMDDKLIIFKENALGYINGIGPDNTGSNSQYSDFILINSVVGCVNQQSIVFMPQGLMFQSNKGIWLLGRDLSTQFIGSPVESYTTGAIVSSAVNVPATNQVRFTLSSGITLMYDYFYGQWGTFTNIPSISSTIYQGLHTYLNDLGQVYQESPGNYLDNTSPVLMNFMTGWINLAGLQGYQRFYFMFLLGQYITPFKLNLQIAYDYNPSMQQSTIVTPSNGAGVFGSGSIWGGDNTWGGTPSAGWESSANVFEARIFPQRQKCESFQISITELYDSTMGQAAGAGLTLSGMNLTIGSKRGYRTSPSSRNFG